jgi:hypothetical protein
MLFGSDVGRERKTSFNMDMHMNIDVYMDREMDIEERYTERH